MDKTVHVISSKKATSTLITIRKKEGAQNATNNFKVSWMAETASAFQQRGPLMIIHKFLSCLARSLSFSKKLTSVVQLIPSRTYSTVSGTKCNNIRIRKNTQKISTICRNKFLSSKIIWYWTIAKKINSMTMLRQKCRCREILMVLTHLPSQ